MTTPSEDPFDFPDLPPAELLDHPEAATLRHAWEGHLQEMLDVIIAAHQRQGRAEAEARALAADAVLALARYMGGRPYYMPKALDLRYAVRDALIWRDFNGKNVQSLCKRYRLTAQRIYQILARQRALQQRLHQDELYA